VNVEYHDTIEVTAIPSKLPRSDWSLKRWHRVGNRLYPRDVTKYPGHVLRYLRRIPTNWKGEIRR
jgi:hypothetical protein